MKKSETVQMEESQSKGRLLDIAARYAENKMALVGLLIIVVIAFFAAFAGFFGSYEDSITLDIMHKLQPPSAEHWFGTDSYGRDIFARCLYGARMSLAIGVFSASIATIAGSLLGAFTGYVGGRIDNLIMRFFDIISAIPSTVMALAVVSALGSGAVKLGLAMAFTSTGPFVRIVRATVLGITNQEYIEACRAGGTSTWRILTKHILPNAIGPIIVQATMDVSTMIRNIATLSFLGLGINPPTPEWGMLIAEAKEFLRTCPHMMLFPAGMLCLAAFCISVLGDGLRDALDPRLKN